ncbi:UNVERIFIED_CONTAM: NAC domain-containing protein [Sesamum latifolium]|uniref:NAC domain-containing protein n=1 Tax=Sesamum latifolium TaxID=2727402 RepID=A0AAW2UZS8_9LAMI
MTIEGDGIVMQIDEDAIVTQLPPGYRFLPTDEELILFYLQNKVCFRPVPCEAVKDIDATELYSNPPNTIVNFSVADDKKEWFFFIHQNKYQKEPEKIQTVGERIGARNVTFGFWRSPGNYEDCECEEKEKTQRVGDEEKIRRVGNGIGFWRSAGKKDPIYDNNGKVFGFKIQFIYFSATTNGFKKTHWRMEEYHLSTTCANGDQEVNSVILMQLKHT